MIGHLGSRVSALLDGNLDADETARAWAHVHACHQCRDRVEREGWVKSRLARLSDGGDRAPAYLKGSLLVAPDQQPVLPSPPGPGAWPDDRPRPRRGLVGAGVVTVGGSAVGAAVLGVLALGASPASAPTMDQRLPVTSIAPAAPGSGGFTPAADRTRGMMGR